MQEATAKAPMNGDPEEGHDVEGLPPAPFATHCQNKEEILPAHLSHHPSSRLRTPPLPWWSCWYTDMLPPPPLGNSAGESMQEGDWSTLVVRLFFGCHLVERC